MIVYRYQHKVDGKGPYTPLYDDSDRDLFGITLANWHNDANHPSPLDDFGPEKLKTLSTREYYCACVSKESLIEWFAGYEEELATHGYEIVEVKVPDHFVFCGKTSKQVLFNINHAEFSSGISPVRLTNVRSMV